MVLWLLSVFSSSSGGVLRAIYSSWAQRLDMVHWLAIAFLRALAESKIDNFILSL